jgi:hypothetical protein
MYENETDTFSASKNAEAQTVQIHYLSVISVNHVLETFACYKVRKNPVCSFTYRGQAQRGHKIPQVDHKSPIKGTVETSHGLVN